MSEWVPHEYSRKFEGGGSILVRGYKCSACGFFRHKKNGTSPYCENCGANMKGETKDA